MEILEPDSAEVVVEVDDSYENDVSEAGDGTSDEANSDLNADDDSKEGIRPFKFHVLLSFYDWLTINFECEYSSFTGN